jgi:hypothetical protein
VGGGDQRGVVIPAQPGASFVAELSFELAVVKLDLPAQPGEASEPPGLGGRGQVGDPVVGRLGLAFGPFGDQCCSPCSAVCAWPCWSSAACLDPGLRSRPVRGDQCSRSAGTTRTGNGCSVS